MDIETVKRQALEEVKEERFRSAVEKQKEWIKRPWHKRIWPWRVRIVIERRDR